MWLHKIRQGVAPRGTVAPVGVVAPEDFVSLGDLEAPTEVVAFRNAVGLAPATCNITYQSCTNIGMCLGDCFSLRLTAEDRSS